MDEEVPRFAIAGISINTFVKNRKVQLEEIEERRKKCRRKDDVQTE